MRSFGSVYLFLKNAEVKKGLHEYWQKIAIR